MNNLNLKQLETFVTVAEKGSFTKAAKDKKGILNSLALEFDKFVKSNFKLN